MDLAFNLPELRDRLRSSRREPEALHSIAVTLAARGEYRRSFLFHRAAAAAAPDRPEYLHDAGNAALGVGRIEDAERLMDDALRLDPSRAGLWLDRGQLFLDHRRNPDAALRCFLEAIRIGQPGPDMYRLAARCVLDADNSSAIPRLRHLLPSNVDPVDADRGVALALAEVGDYEQALPILFDIVRRCPDDHSSMRVLAELHTGLRDSNAARCWYERALSQANDRAAVIGYLLHWSRLGDFERARRVYEERMRGPAFDEILRPAARRWRGEDLAGKSLRLIVGDIYFGDAIQFSRFAAIAKRMGARVILQGPKRLRPMLRTLEWVDAVVAPHDRIPPTDYEASAFWLLFSLTTPVDEMIGRAPYLQPDESLRAEWRHRIPRTAGLNVGIAWRGSPYRIRDRFGSRSLRLEELRPLAAVPHMNLYSLQCGEGRAELHAAPTFPAVDLAPDFPNTAAAISVLDAVVTIDTSIAHLAGALGKRTLLMLPYDACFRWMLDRDDTPWYPSVRLFRQSRPGVWSDVVARVAQALSQ